MIGMVVRKEQTIDLSQRNPSLPKPNRCATAGIDYQDLTSRLDERAGPEAVRQRRRCRRAEKGDHKSALRLSGRRKGETAEKSSRSQGCTSQAISYHAHLPSSPTKFPADLVENERHIYRSRQGKFDQILPEPVSAATFLMWASAAAAPVVFVSRSRVASPWSSTGVSASSI
jgi:hypothetical protein